MYATFIPKIKAAIESVSAIKEVYAYPLAGNPKSFPAVVFFPDEGQSSFETNAENMKTYRFRMWIMIDLAGIDEEQAFTDILPKAVDAVSAALDAAWDQGTSLDGHRIWLSLDSGSWGLAVEQEAKRAYAEMVITVRALSTN